MFKHGTGIGFSCLVLLLLFFGCKDMQNPLSGNNPVSISFNFKPDSTYLYIMDSRLLLMPEVNGKTLSIKQEMKLLSTYKVTEVRNGQRDVTVTYTRITMSSGNGIVSQDFDSDDTTNRDPIFIPVASMIKKPFSIAISDKGVSGGMQQLYASQQTDSLSEPESLSDSSLRKMMVQCLNIYPPQQVKPGDSWKRTYTTSTGFINIRLENTFTLKSVANGIAQIQLSSNIFPENPEQDMAFSGIQNGDMEVDIESGLILNSRISQQLKGKLIIAGKESPVSANSEIRIYGSKQQ